MTGIDRNEGVVPARQERSRQTHRKLVDACVALLQERNFETVSIAEISAAAGVSVGNFYRRFRTKEALLPDLYKVYDQQFALFQESIEHDERFRSPDLETRLLALLERTAEFLSENSGLVRALYLNSRAHPEIVPEGATVRRGLLYRQVASLLPSPPGEGSEITGKVARVIALVMVSTLLQQVIFPDQTPAAATELDQGRLVKELAIMFEQYTVVRCGADSSKR